MAPCRGRSSVLRAAVIESRHSCRHSGSNARFVSRATLQGDELAWSTTMLLLVYSSRTLVGQPPVLACRICKVHGSCNSGGTVSCAKCVLHISERNLTRRTPPSTWAATQRRWPEELESTANTPGSVQRPARRRLLQSSLLIHGAQLNMPGPELGCEVTPALSEVSLARRGPPHDPQFGGQGSTTAIFCHQC